MSGGIYAQVVEACRLREWSPDRREFLRWMMDVFGARPVKGDGDNLVEFLQAVYNAGRVHGIREERARRAQSQKGDANASPFWGKSFGIFAASSRLPHGSLGVPSLFLAFAISQYSKNGTCYYRTCLAAVWGRSSCFALGLRKNAALFVPIQLQPVVKPHGHKPRLTAAPVEHGGRAVMEAL